MKIYRFWVTEKQKILIDGMVQDITCYGGSNLSNVVQLHDEITGATFRQPLA